MAFRQQLAKATSLKESDLPSGYQIVGDIALLKLGCRESEKKKIAEAVMKLLPYVRSVCEISSIAGEFREPKIRLLAGDRTETIHTENGIKYHIDVSQVMFSKGNAFERQRLIKKVKESETVVDMFAGIGYFSLPIAKHAKAKIIAIEKNLNAFRFLQDNIKLNGIHGIDPVFGDCRDFSKSAKNIADRVIMGYLPETEEFLPDAISLAKNNAVVHFHNIYQQKNLWKKPADDIEKACEDAGCGFEILNRRKVKSYKPRTFHVVVDFRVFKAARPDASRKRSPSQKLQASLSCICLSALSLFRMTLRS